MEEKIRKIKKNIIDNHINNFEFKMNEVLSMCESPIEKLMILQLFNFFQNYNIKIKDTEFSKFTEIDFIAEEICLWDFDEPLSEFKKKVLEDKINKFEYRKNNYGMFNKYVGFKCTINISEPINISENDNGVYFRDIEIYPQFYQFYPESYNRIDVAFILKKRDWYNNNNIVEERKIAIECDGYDYHSSPKQKMEDDVRARKLKRAGWKEVLRYSGTEIYNINDNLERVNLNFEEIMDIIML